MTPRASLAALPILLSLLGSVPLRAQALREILFLRGDGTLCSVSADGARRVCLPQSAFSDALWRPGTAEFVAFNEREDREEEEPDSLYLYDRDGNPLRPFHSSKRYGASAWSPDGRFLYARGENGAIARWDADGRSRSILHVTGGPPDARAEVEAFSPSGKRAALITHPKVSVELADVAPDGFQVTAVSAQDFEWISSAVWRDEDHLLFLGSRRASATEQTQLDLWELSVVDGGVRRIGIDSLWALGKLVLSPDRSTVIVSASVGPLTHTSLSLWFFSLATKSVRQLTSGSPEGDHVTSWSDRPAEGDCGVCSLEGNARMIRRITDKDAWAEWWDIDLRSGLGLVETYRDPAELWATSILRPGGSQPSCEADPNWGCQFSPSRALRVPPDSAHAWCEGVAGDGIGEILTVPSDSTWAGRASQGADLRPPGSLTGLQIRPGYGKSPALFLANGRPHQLHVVAVHRQATYAPKRSKLLVSDLGIVELHDANTWQSVRLPEVNLENLLFIALEIRSVYPGTRYHDTCISGVLPARTQTAPRH